MELHILLIVVGLVGGFLAGWVGLGGGIILAPLLLYAPSVMGLSPWDMKEVARFTIVQSLFSTSAAALAHQRSKSVNGRLVVWSGAFIIAASLSGAIFSECQVVSCEILHGLFAAMALIGSVLMFRPPPNLAPKLKYPNRGLNHERNDAASHSPSFSRGRAAVVALSVGFFGGMVGQSGAFLTIPLLIHVVRMPVRLAIGSSLGITFCAALAGSLGKLAGGGPIIWTQVAVLIAGSLIGSQLGAAVSRRQRATLLRYVLAVSIGASALGMWYDIFN